MSGVLVSISVPWQASTDATTQDVVLNVARGTALGTSGYERHRSGNPLSPFAEFSDDLLEALRACDEQLGLIIDLFPDDLMEQFDTDLSPDSRANGSQSIGFQPGMSRPQGRQGLGRRLADRLAAM